MKQQPKCHIARLSKYLRQRLGEGQQGSALVEFLGVGLVLLIPILYLIIALSQVQAASFAADTAARESARAVVTADDMAAAVGRARAATNLAFSDQKIPVNADSALALTCEEDPCLSPGKYVFVEISTEVKLPLMPDFVANKLGASVHIEAHAMAEVDEFAEAP